MMIQVTKGDILLARLLCVKGQDVSTLCPVGQALLRMGYEHRVVGSTGFMIRKSGETEWVWYVMPKEAQDLIRRFDQGGLPSDAELTFVVEVEDPLAVSP